MNYSAFLFDTARWAVVELERADVPAIDAAVVFSVMALEAAVNEQAHLAYQLGEVRWEDWEAADEDAGGAKRLNALVKLVCGKGLDLGSRLGQDLDRLIILRSGLTHYRPVPKKSRLSQVLTELHNRGFIGEISIELGWPVFMTKSLARWAVETASAVAFEIADLLPNENEAKLVRTTFSL